MEGLARRPNADVSPARYSGPSHPRPSTLKHTLTRWTRPTRMTGEHLPPGPSTGSTASSELQPRLDAPVLDQVLAVPSQQRPTTAPHNSRMIDVQQDIGHDHSKIDPSLLHSDSGHKTGEQPTAKTPTLHSLSEPRHAPPKNFACPYHKRQPGKYLSSSCSRHGFPTIDRLKEHLYRRHESQPYCARCYATFPNREQLKQHQETGPCLPAPDSQIPPIEGITESMKQQLQKRHRGLTAEEKWTMTYKILFPGDQEIPSPCESCTANAGEIFSLTFVWLDHEVDQLFNHSISTEVLEFAHFSQSIVPDLTRRRAEEAMREQRLEGLDELLDLLPELSRTVGAEALYRWRAEKCPPDSTTLPAPGVDEAFRTQSPTFALDSGPAHNETTPCTAQNSTSVSSASKSSSSSSSSATNYACKLCGKSFSRRSNAMRHEKDACAVRSRGPRHQCSSCSKSFHRSDALRFHIAKEHPEPEALQVEQWPGKHPIREDPMELDGG